MSGTAAGVTVRPAQPGDAAAIVQLVRDLAVYERLPASVVQLTEADVLRDGFGTPPRFEWLLAEWQGRVEVFVLFFQNDSTWEARRGLFLEDLVVREAVRGKGLGGALLQAIGGALLDSRRM